MIYSFIPRLGLYLQMMVCTVTICSCEWINSPYAKVRSVAPEWVAGISFGGLTQGQMPPTLSKDGVLVLGLEQGKDILRLIDKKSGRQRWQWNDFLSPTEKLTTYRTHTFNNVAVIDNAISIYAVDMNTGKTLWRKTRAEQGDVWLTGFNELYFTSPGSASQQSGTLSIGNVLTGAEYIAVYPLFPALFLPPTAWIDPLSKDTMLVAAGSQGKMDSTKRFFYKSYIALYNLSKRQWIYQLLQRQGYDVDSQNPNGQELIAPWGPCVDEREGLCRARAAVQREWHATNRTRNRRILHGHAEGRCCEQQCGRNLRGDGGGCDSLYDERGCGQAWVVHQHLCSRAEARSRERKRHARGRERQGRCCGRKRGKRGRGMQQGKGQRVACAATETTHGWVRHHHRHHARRCGERRRYRDGQLCGGKGGDGCGGQRRTAHADAGTREQPRSREREGGRLTHETVGGRKHRERGHGIHHRQHKFAAGATTKRRTLRVTVRVTVHDNAVVHHTETQQCGALHLRGGEREAHLGRAHKRRGNRLVIQQDPCARCEICSREREVLGKCSHKHHAGRQTRERWYRVQHGEGKRCGYGGCAGRDDLHLYGGGGAEERGGNGDGKLVGIHRRCADDGGGNIHHTRHHSLRVQHRPAHEGGTCIAHARVHKICSREGQREVCHAHRGRCCRKHGQCGRERLDEGQGLCCGGINATRERFFVGADVGIGNVQQKRCRCGDGTKE